MLGGRIRSNELRGDVVKRERRRVPFPRLQTFPRFLPDHVLDRGTDFDIDSMDGVFVEYSVSCGDSWWDLTKGAQQTQTAYADEQNEVVFSHPVDLHFSSTSVGEWPRLNFHVFK